MSIAGTISAWVRPIPGSRRELFDASSSAQIRPEAAVHNDAIDVVRFFAAAGIVFVHAEQSSAFDRWDNVCRFAVPFFLFASFYYQSISLKRRADCGLWKYIAARGKRLYLPFLAWSCIYIVVRDVKRVTLLHLPLVKLHPDLLVKGPEYHLWFLPFLLVGSILLAVIDRGMLQRNPRWRWILIAAAVAAGLAIGWAPMPAGWDETFDNKTYAYVQWWRALPSGLFGLAFAWLMTMGPRVYSVRPIAALAGVGILAMGTLDQVRHGIDPIARAMTGLGCMLAALAPWRGAIVKPLARIGRYGYGIYLSHVLPVEVTHVITARMGFAPSAGLDLATFAISFAGTVLLVLAIARSRRLAWLNG